MSAMQHVALRNVAQIERDIVDPSAIEDGTLYVGLENIESGGRFVGVRPVDAGELLSSKFSFTPRHLLYGKLRPYLAKIARPEFDGICSTDILPVLPGHNLDRSYLAWLLLSPHMVAQASSRATGANLPRLSPNALAELTIPLPSLHEQRRIAEILDKADALRVKRREILARLDTLTQSIFLDMFGDPATNPKGWPYSRLGDVTDFYAGSTLPAGDAFNGQADGYFLLKVSDMNLAGNKVYLESCQQWSAEPGAASSTCPAGSVVIPKRGGAIGTNKKRIAVRPSVLDPNLMAIWPRPDLIELSFLYSWLLRLDLASITSGSSVPQLNKRDLDPLSIPVPPLEAQREFSHKFGAMEGVVMLHDRALSVCDTLFAALQHGAFQGEL